MSFLFTYWREIIIGLLGFIVLMQWQIILFHKKRKASKEIAPILNDIRKTLRDHHLQQKDLFREIDSFLSEIPAYINQKSKGGGKDVE